MPSEGGEVGKYEVTFISADFEVDGDVAVKLMYPPTLETSNIHQVVNDCDSGEVIITDYLPAGDLASGDLEWGYSAKLYIGPYTSSVFKLIAMEDGATSRSLFRCRTCGSEEFAHFEVDIASGEDGLPALKINEERTFSLEAEEGFGTIDMRIKRLPPPTVRELDGQGFGICICRAWFLPDLDYIGASDPTVVAEVRSKDNSILATATTRVCSNNLNPIWDQVLFLSNIGSWQDATLNLSIRDKDILITEQIGQVSMPLSQLLERPYWKCPISANNGTPVVSTIQPHWPSEISFAVVPSTIPAGWKQPVPDKTWTAADYPKHIFMMTRGTRGDVQPFVALARGMAEQLGWMVTICTELRWQEFVKSKANVKRGRIRFRPSGGDTEAKMQQRVSQWALKQKSEMMQMIILANSEADFFNSSTTFMNTVIELDEEPIPVDLLICGLTVIAVGAVLAEYLEKPMAGYILQPTVIPSTDKSWKAVQAIESHSIGLVDTVEEKLFTSHTSLTAMKSFFEGNPLNKYSISHIRKWYNLGATRGTWDHLQEHQIPVIIPIREGTFKRPSDWGDEVQLTDFIFLRDPPKAGAGTSGGGGFGLGEPLDSFLSNAKSAGAKVGIMTFSSMPVMRRTMLTCATSMVEECKHKMHLIYAGKKQSDSVPADLEEKTAGLVQQKKFVEVERADFGKLFKFMDFFIIQGGLGTTVEALRMKKPVAVSGPLLLDQRFWGQVCFDKGVGPEPTEINRFPKICVDFVNDALDPNDPKGYQAKAKAGDWGEESEDGVKANVDAFAAILHDDCGRFLEEEGLISSLRSIPKPR
jgi:hypothetical protein